MLRRTINYLFHVDEIQALYRQQTGTPKEKMAAVKNSPGYKRISMIARCRGLVLGGLSFTLMMVAVAVQQAEMRGVIQPLTTKGIPLFDAIAAVIALAAVCVGIGLWLGTRWGERRAARLAPADQ
ncbi:hypothetical protein [Nitrospirillum pindoramense]|uniref:Uncharacterized protein n=1 Tax=Nitrospirillum amazonense TaxID=28077 RepID=A0A560H6G1_9PROT|nr:hypothetical protein [Nitrospirillum amazonense]TWB41897.1 hypothetical protein FBZ90_107273 [Nitrospirillum amazonense]